MFEPGLPVCTVRLVGFRGPSFQLRVLCVNQELLPFEEICSLLEETGHEPSGATYSEGTV